MKSASAPLKLTRRHALASLCLALGGFIGCVSCIACDYYPVGPMEPMATGAWIFGAALLSSLDTLRLALMREGKPQGCCQRFQKGCSWLTLVLAAVLFLCVSISRQGVNAVAAVLAVGCCGLAVLFRRCERPNDHCCGGCLLSLLTIVLGLLVSGSVQEANFAVTYPVGKGDFVRVELEGGQSQQLYFECQGPLDSPYPLVVPSASFSHGAPDFWPLQRELVALGYRVCIYDYPGLGFSDAWLPSQEMDAQSFFPSLLKAMGAGPYLLLGWGGGGPVSYNFARAAPQQVAGLVYVDVSGDGVEWLTGDVQTENLQAKIQADLSGRYTMFTIIRGLTIPWGLMSIFVPYNPESYAGTEAEYAEFRHWMLRARTWTSQFFSLRHSDESVYSAGLVQPGYLGVYEEKLQLPVLAVVDALNKTTFCDKRRLEGERCDEQHSIHEGINASRLDVAEASGDVSFVACEEASCGLDMPYRMPTFVAEAVHSWWQHQAP